MCLSVDIILPEKWWQPAKYRLLNDLKVNGKVVPAGFISDGATVPRPAWPIFPPIGRYAPQAFLHDYLLTVWSRKNADYAFLDALRSEGISPWRYWTMFGAVRLFSIIKGG